MKRQNTQTYVNIILQKPFQKFGFKIKFLYTSLYSVAHLQLTVISEGYQWIGTNYFSSVVDTDRYNRKETFTTEPVTTECRDVVVKR